MSRASARILAADAPVARRRLLAGIAGSVVFAGLTVVGANIEIPLRPVPITLQTLFVLLSGAVLGRGFGSLGQALYVGAGVTGLPVFAGGVGGAALALGPTGGYLLGFMVAPLIVGALIERRRALWWQIFALYLGSLTILAFGVIYLGLFYTHDLAEAVRVGYLPFVPGDLLKILAAASIYRSYRAFRAAG